MLITLTLLATIRPFFLGR